MSTSRNFGIFYALQILFSSNIEGGRYSNDNHFLEFFMMLIFCVEILFFCPVLPSLYRLLEYVMFPRCVGFELRHQYQINTSKCCVCEFLHSQFLRSRISAAKRRNVTHQTLKYRTSCFPGRAGAQWVDSMYVRGRIQLGKLKAYNSIYTKL